MAVLGHATARKTSLRLPEAGMRTHYARTLTPSAYGHNVVPSTPPTQRTRFLVTLKVPRRPGVQKMYRLRLTSEHADVAPHWFMLALFVALALLFIAATTNHFTAAGVAIDLAFLAAMWLVLLTPLRRQAGANDVIVVLRRTGRWDRWDAFWFEDRATRRILFAVGPHNFRPQDIAAALRAAGFDVVDGLPAEAA
jgi:hypothetical protein